jgi:DNA repair protein RadC
MAITDWPSHERPREKLLEKGAQALSDAELVAIILRTGTRGRTALDIAREMLIKHGDLRSLLNASVTEISAFVGLGVQTYAHLQAVKEIGKRLMQENLCKDNVLTHVNGTKQFFQGKLQDLAHEVFACLFLDARHRPIKYSELFQGTLNQTIVHPREVVKQSLYHNAASVIIAHNHPSGDAHPSALDLELTEQLREALALVEIRLLDHIIVGTEKTISCAELGYLSKERIE